MPGIRLFGEGNVAGPSHGQHSFLLKGQSSSIDQSFCVNALARATLISTTAHLTESTRSRLCQCPRTGNTHFYVLQNGWAVMDIPECQCPRTGNTHFYDKFPYIPRFRGMVSMPSHGQHSFLLYPFKTLYFMRKTDPLFAGNSQNILKKAFFWGFTRMFTVCSYLSILSNLFLPLSIHFDYTIIYAKKTGTPTEINSPKPPLIFIWRSYFQ